MELWGVCLLVLKIAIDVIGSYLIILGIVLFESARNEGVVHYDKKARQWNVWYGDRNTSNSVTIVQCVGNIFKVWWFVMTYAKPKRNTVEINNGN